MTEKIEEYIDERERDLLDYIRNNISDPENRSVFVENESFTASEGQDTFILEHNFAKNVADKILVNDVAIRKGYNYRVEYGQGSDVTKVILSSGLSAGDELKISYNYGSSLVEREYSRTDVKLPRIVVIFLMGDEEIAGLGDHLEYGKGSYFNVAYRIEIRDKYANRARRLASQAFNIFRKMRHDNLFRVNITMASGMQNFDYDRDKEAYIWQFTADLQWELRFE